MHLVTKGHLNWTLVAFAVALSYALFLVAMSLSGFWLHDADHRIIANDFIDVFAAGKFAASGHAWQVYDWAAHKTAEVGIAGHPFSEYYGWHYPPPLLLAAVALAQLPYTAAFLAWIVATLLLYAVVIARIAEKHAAVLWACAFPAALFCAYVGQNGFLTAALFGASLLTHEERPWLSGILIGLLTYKPQFGILIPFVLLASGSWRAFLSAAVTAAVMVGVSGAMFGWQTWSAFLHSIPHTTDAVLTAGQAGWNKLQTVYGLARWMGADSHMALAWQAFTTMLAISTVSLLWRSRVLFGVKAAALIVGTLLATPYAYIYDFTLLSVAMAFLYRARTFDQVEIVSLLAATLIVAGVVVRRWYQTEMSADVGRVDTEVFRESGTLSVHS